MSGLLRHRLERREVVSCVLANRQDLLVVSGLGASTYDGAAAGDHDRNFYLWGAMGGAAMIGFGLALAQPQTPVLVITGDGELLMGLGSLATIGAQSPRNLGILVLDNGLYEETGAQPTHTVLGTDLTAVARACGIARATFLDDMAQVADFATRVHQVEAGPIVAVARIMPSQAMKVLPTRDGAYVARRMRRALGHV
jgi:thiamine pyrophosphate-dependent acetolactate synthase large subunit-like protein